MFQSLNPYRTPNAVSPSVSDFDAEPEKFLLLTIGVVMGVELVGIPLLVVLALAVGIDFTTHPFWVVFGVLTIAAILAGLIFAKLLRLAKPGKIEMVEFDERDLFSVTGESADHRR